MEQEVINIVNGLIQKTKARQAYWFNSEFSNSYSIYFDGAKVVVSKYASILNDNYQFIIYNNDGKAVVKVDTGLVVGAELVKTLYNVVEASFSKKDETISSILGNLESAGPVGLPQNPEDEVPF